MERSRGHRASGARRSADRSARPARFLLRPLSRSAAAYFSGRDQPRAPALARLLSVARATPSSSRARSTAWPGCAIRCAMRCAAMEPDVVVSTCPIYSFLIEEIYRDGRDARFHADLAGDRCRGEGFALAADAGRFFCRGQRIGGAGAGGGGRAGKENRGLRFPGAISARAGDAKGKSPARSGRQGASAHSLSDQQRAEKSAEADRPAAGTSRVGRDRLRRARHRSRRNGARQGRDRAGADGGDRPHAPDAGTCCGSITSSSARRRPASCRRRLPRGVR